MKEIENGKERAKKPKLTCQEIVLVISMNQTIW
jgi:hypothetical protein